MAGRRAARWLPFLFFLSGAAGLAFETLWFRLAGVSLGNSVWSGSMVLSSFMGGLALGTWLVGRHGARVARPIRLYAGLELLIGLLGLLVVQLLPALPTALAPLFGALGDRPPALALLRFGVAFLLLAVPAAAMGATLPLLVLGLCRVGTGFGQALGLLYGVNTLGAVAGAVSVELVLVRALGVRGTALVAAAANLVAAGLALWLARGERSAHRSSPGPAAAPSSDLDAPTSGQPAGASPPVPLGAHGTRLLVAAALAGALLLALEVVWFRTLLLFTFGTSQAFALMLAVVLTGIGLGGLCAARLDQPSQGRAAFLACLAGVLLVLTHAGLLTVLLPAAMEWRGTAGILGRAAWLAGPVSFVSGLLFPTLGQELQARLGASERASGYLAMANTLGAMLGAALGGLVLLPRLGTDGSLRLLASGYLLLALLLLPRPLGAVPGRTRASLAGLLAAAAAAVALFPQGVLERNLLRQRGLPGEVVAVREGLTETIIYLRQERFGRTHTWQLLTNGYAMSAANVHGKQYMKFFVHLPVALHPDPRTALLICYGVGSTAKALTDSKGLEQIDVVDISRDILELSSLVHPDPAQHPLRDQRVRVHVEDGRFHLQTTSTRYDLITAEPPPPHGAGVGNLYSREFFQLVHDHLAPGGMTTCWLPVTQMDESGSRAIVRAFLDVFDETSLWMGSGPEWVLLGVRAGGRPVTAEEFSRQWRDRVVGPELAALGWERPEHLATAFLADRALLDQLCQDSSPLEDDHPYRLYPVPRSERRHESAYAELLDPIAAARRFAASGHAARLWPPEIVQASLPAFAHRLVMHDVMHGPRLGAAEHELATVQRLLTSSDLRTLPLWLLGSDGDEQRIVDAVREELEDDPTLQQKLGDRALVERRWADAAAHYARAPGSRPAEQRRLLALLLGGRADAAQAVLAEIRRRPVGSRREAAFLRFVAETWGLETSPLR